MTYGPRQVTRPQVNPIAKTTVTSSLHQAKASRAGATQLGTQAAQVVQGIIVRLGAGRGIIHHHQLITSSQLVCRPGYVPKNYEDYAPHTLYGQSKVQTELITRAWKGAPCPWTLIRPTSIWGPWFHIP